MFKIHNNGILGLDYDRIVALTQYSVIFDDDQELILPQTLIALIERRLKRAILH